MLVTFQGVSSLTWLVAIYHTVHIENISVTAEYSLDNVALVYLIRFPLETTVLGSIVFISSNDLGDSCHVTAKMDCFSVGTLPLWGSSEKSSRTRCALSHKAFSPHGEVG